LWRSQQRHPSSIQSSVKVVNFCQVAVFPIRSSYFKISDYSVLRHKVSFRVGDTALIFRLSADGDFPPVGPAHTALVANTGCTILLRC